MDQATRLMFPNKGLFAREKRIIGPFQGAYSALFVRISETSRGPTPAQQPKPTTLAQREESTKLYAPFARIPLLSRELFNRPRLLQIR